MPGLSQYNLSLTLGYVTAMHIEHGASSIIILSEHIIDNSAFRRSCRVSCVFPPSPQVLLLGMIAPPPLCWRLRGALVHLR